MFDQYKSLVLKFYYERLNTTDFSNNLKTPTPGKLKTECLRVYEERFVENDRRLMKDFFLDADENGHYDSAIRNADIDRFRPLERFLKNRTTGPDSINIELLAWLIDYQPRPFRFETFKPPTEVTKPGFPPAEMPKEDPIPPVVIPETDSRKGKEEKPWYKNRYIQWSIYAFIASALILSTSIIIERNKGYADGSMQCMYWDTDHYKAIGCNEQVFGKEVIALDTTIQKHFRRITRPDTMTAYSVDKVYYLKINDVPECFTGPGKHPLYRHRNLKPLSLVMLRKYFGELPSVK